VTGINRISRDDVLNKVDLDKPTNILAINLSEMAGKLKTIPGSRKSPDAQTPGHNHVNVVERLPPP
jgi:hypothetical protein